MAWKPRAGPSFGVKEVGRRGTMEVGREQVGAAPEGFFGPEARLRLPACPERRQNQ